MRTAFEAGMQKGAGLAADGSRFVGKVAPLTLLGGWLGGIEGAFNPPREGESAYDKLFRSIGIGGTAGTGAGVLLALLSRGKS